MADSMAAVKGAIGGYTRAARTTDWKTANAAARRAWFARFADEVDPNGLLDGDERFRQAKLAQRIYMSRLRLGQLTERRRRDDPRATDAQVAAAVTRLAKIEAELAEAQRVTGRLNVRAAS